jgi:hypothetical protein
MSQSETRVSDCTACDLSHVRSRFASSDESFEVLSFLDLLSLEARPVLSSSEEFFISREECTVRFRFCNGRPIIHL